MCLTVVRNGKIDTIIYTIIVHKSVIYWILHVYAMHRTCHRLLSIMSTAIFYFNSLLPFTTDMLFCFIAVFFPFDCLDMLFTFSPFSPPHTQEIFISRHYIWFKFPNITHIKMYGKKKRTKLHTQCVAPTPTYSLYVFLLVGFTFHYTYTRTHTLLHRVSLSWCFFFSEFHKNFMRSKWFTAFI